MFRLTITCSAAVAVLALSVGGSQPSLAQGEMFGMYGSGPNRVCSVLVDTADNTVFEKGNPDNPVLTNHTYDCPEAMAQPVAQIAPAAPPPEPLPASGVVYFAFDKADLTPSAESTLNSIIGDIKDRDLGGITVGGHTDTAGPPDYNMQLSQRRANTVAAELVKAGIPARIVTTEAFGETDLAVQTPDNTPDQANRRATIDFKR
jgi:outer membrane protein OmpA-like peptidoglycan-associated protein